MNHIYNQLYNNNKNSLIHYVNNGSAFDLLIDRLLGDDIVRSTNQTDIEYFSTKSILINDYQQFIFSDVSQNYYVRLGIKNIIIFLHSDISGMKKEDLFLIKHRLKNFIVINTHPNNNTIFDTNIPLAVPKIKISNKSNNKKILLMSNSREFSSLSSILKNTKIDLIDFNAYSDYNTLLNYLIDYPLVIYTNLIDGMAASSIGCQTISADSILENNKIVASEINKIKINYDFDTFSRMLTKVIRS